MSDRRRFLQGMASLPILGGALPAIATAAPAAGRDYFAELGIRTFINAAGTFTALSASIMAPEVTDAWNYASAHYATINEVQDKCGARIASLVGAEAAMVSSGAFGAMVSGTAGCITGMDQKAVSQLPDTTGLKNEVLVQKTHRVGYDHAIRATGAKLIEVETAEELERAINPKTAMLMFFNFCDPAGQIKRDQFIAIGKKHGVPTFNDCAADVPPVGNLKAMATSGFDLVAFSGGKGLRGPQSAGLLLGRKDLIAAARLNTSPNGDTIGRGMKVNKEEILGMMVAVEAFLKADHEAIWKEWERRTKVIADAVREVPGMQSETFVPEIANHVPHLKLWWGASKVKLTPPEVAKRLRDGKPSIEVNPMTNPKELVIGVWMMQDGDAEVVARQLRSVFQSA